MEATRNTRQKKAIRAAFEQTNQPLSPEEVLAFAIGQVPRLSIATVYRNIHALVESGWLVSLELPGEPKRYERTDEAHHHHFRCDHCGKLYQLPGCLLRERFRLPRGFRARRHEIFVYGLCAACA